MRVLFFAVDTLSANTTLLSCCVQRMLLHVSRLLHCRCLWKRRYMHRRSWWILLRMSTWLSWIKLRERLVAFNLLMYVRTLTTSLHLTVLHLMKMHNYIYSYLHIKWQSISVVSDFCADGTCQNGGSCTRLVNGFDCTCLLGYYDNRCQYGKQTYINALLLSILLPWNISPRALSTICYIFFYFSLLLPKSLYERRNLQSFGGWLQLQLCCWVLWRQLWQ